MKIIKWTLIGLVALAIIYMLGPRPKYQPIDTTPISFDIPLETIDAYIESKESEVSEIKPDNEARIVWADSVKRKTEYAIVYLHGFSASSGEGDPVHLNFAKRYNMNLYLPRLLGNGLESPDAFRGITPYQMINDAKEAIAIGKLLGEKVILMSCSTGSTFSILLAPEDPAIHSLIMFSPNIDIEDPTSELIIKPWGESLLGLVMGGEYNYVDYNKEQAKYWSEKYHTDGLIALKYLLHNYMKEPFFSKVSMPLFMAYYYKNEEHKDHIVCVEDMMRFYDQVSTDEKYKVKINHKEAQGHVFVSKYFENDFSFVENELYQFADRILGAK